MHKHAKEPVHLWTGSDVIFKIQESPGIQLISQA